MIPFDFEFFWRNLLAFVVFVDWCVGISVTTGGAVCNLFFWKLNMMNCLDD